MPALLEKLNWKDQTELVILNAPQSFELPLPGREAPLIQTQAETVQKIFFLLAFVTTPQGVADLIPMIQQKCPGDPVLWFAYPKKNSKKYKSDLTRDSGWQALQEIGLRPVRQIAIDEDWSALRFRRPEFVKTAKA